MLSWFRRHATILMVVLGSSAMVIFGFGSVIESFFRPANNNVQENKVVATWKGGEFTRSQLTIMERRHYQTLRFLRGVQVAAAADKGGPITPLAKIFTPIAEGQREWVDSQLVDRLLLAERAKEEGMIVSDGMVNDYISMISGQADFSIRDLEAINLDVNNRGCSVQALREYLKCELAFNQMNIYSNSSNFLFPNPTESTELYGRTVEQIECEVLPVDVDQYVSQVDGTPSPALLEKLFEDGKHSLPDPRGILPGFKINRKIKAQYFVANYDTFLENELNKLTDEQVQAEYDRLVKEESPIVMEPVTAEDDAFEINDAPPTLPAKTDPAAPANEGSTEGGSTEGDATEGDATEGDATEGDTESPDDVDLPPAAETNEKSKETNEKSKPDSGSGGETPTKPESPEKDGSEESGNGDQSVHITTQKIRYTSTTVQDPETGNEKQPSPPDETGGSQDDDEAPQPPTDAAAVQLPSNTPGAPALKLQDDKKMKRRAKPLKDVVDTVKNNMCTESTNKAMQESLAKAANTIEGHFHDLLAWDATPPEEQTEKPVAPDFEAIAKKYNLEPRETGLLDFEELSVDPLGRIRFFYNPGGNNQRAEILPIAQLIFGSFNELHLYDAQSTTDMFETRSAFLYWLTEKEEARIPSFIECKPEIEAFWRKQEAIKLAKIEAEKIMTRVNNSTGKKMSDLYAERATSTGAFTWFNSFGDTNLSTPFGVTFPSDEFMSVAFSLPELEAGVAPNETQDTIYVIQSISGGKSPAEVGDDYLENQFFRFEQVPQEVLKVAGWYGNRLKRQWYENFHEEMDLKFLDQ